MKRTFQQDPVALREARRTNWYPLTFAMMGCFVCCWVIEQIGHMPSDVGDVLLSAAFNPICINQSQLWTITSEKPVKSVAIAGGTHGNERNGVYLVSEFMRNPSLVKRDTFETTCLHANPEAIRSNSRYVDKVVVCKAVWLQAPAINIIFDFLFFSLFQDMNRCFLLSDLEADDKYAIHIISLHLGIFSQLYLTWSSLLTNSVLSSYMIWDQKRNYLSVILAEHILWHE